MGVIRMEISQWALAESVAVDPARPISPSPRGAELRPRNSPTSGYVHSAFQNQPKRVPDSASTRSTHAKRKAVTWAYTQPHQPRGSASARDDSTTSAGGPGLASEDLARVGPLCTEFHRASSISSQFDERSAVRCAEHCAAFAQKARPNTARNLCVCTGTNSVGVITGRARGTPRRSRCGSEASERSVSLDSSSSRTLR